MRRHSSGADFNKMFTPRENEILAFLLQGCSHKELPDALKVGQGTIHTHITHLRKK
jgi:DNA-binding NarL/FixJ family response regulator